MLDSDPSDVGSSAGALLNSSVTEITLFSLACVTVFLILVILQ